MQAQLETTAAEDYLAAEARSEGRHEFVAGEIRAMTGGTVRHNLVSGAIFARVRTAARKEKCRAGMADIKVFIPNAVVIGKRKTVGDIYYYPDVVVSCEPIEHDSQRFVAPCLIVEVTSPSTVGFDKFEKFAHYRQLPSLQCFLLVQQATRTVDCYTRAAAPGEWRLQTFEEQGSMELPCPRMSISLDEIFEDVGDEISGDDA
jgi:Uma2 family endonuclease